MSLTLLRRVPVAGLAPDPEWAHSANTPAQWLARGFILDTDGQHGRRVPPGKDGRIVSICVVAEDTNDDEVDGDGAISLEIATVQLVDIEIPPTVRQVYRQREPVEMRLGDLIGETDITRQATRLFPRIVSIPTGLNASVTSLAFYVGVL